MYCSMPTTCGWGKDNKLKAKETYVSNMEINGHIDLQVLVSGLVVNIQITLSWVLVQMVLCVIQFHLIPMDY